MQALDQKLSANDREHDFPRLCRLAFVDNQDIAIMNAGVDHGVTAGAEEKK